MATCRPTETIFRLTRLKLSSAIWCRCVRRASRLRAIPPSRPSRQSRKQHDISATTKARRRLAGHFPADPHPCGNIGFRERRNRRFGLLGFPAGARLRSDGDGVYLFARLEETSSSGSGEIFLLAIGLLSRRPGGDLLVARVAPGCFCLLPADRSHGAAHVADHGCSAAAAPGRSAVAAALRASPANCQPGAGAVPAMAIVEDFSTA